MKKKLRRRVRELEDYVDDLIALIEALEADDGSRVSLDDVKAGLDGR